MPVTPEERFRSLYAATYPEVLAFARRRVGEHDGHDIAAEVYAVAWRRLADVPRDDPRPWLFAVARNVLRGDSRGQRRREALAVKIASVPGRAAPGPDGVEDLVAARLDIAAAWARLSAPEQETLALTVWDRLDASGAGRVLGISATAYRMRLSRARAALRHHLDHAGSPASRREVTHES